MAKKHIENNTAVSDKKIRYSSRGKVIPVSAKFDDILKNNLEVNDIGNTIVLLTRENVNIIEKLIEKDDNYLPFSKIIFTYFGADKVKNNTENALFIVIREIDRDNSTNVWRYEKNRANFYKIMKYIEESGDEFWNGIEAGDITLPDKIVEKSGSNVKSLASKICKYLCEFVYEKDNYYINDSYVRAMLLFYLDCYGIEHPDLKSINDVNKLSYAALYELLEKLHNARNTKHNGKISKSELDHVLWYCYKSFDL